MDYANVIVDIAHSKLDKIFQYKIPVAIEEQVVPGVCVEVPFGRGNRLIKGYVTGLSKKTGLDMRRIKEIHRIVADDIEVEDQLISLAAWMREQYGGTMIQALKTVLPVRKKMEAKEKKYVRLTISTEEAAGLSECMKKKGHRARARLLAGLLEDEVLPYGTVTKDLNITSVVIKALEEMGIIEVVSEKVYRNPISSGEKSQKRVSLNQEQQAAVDGILKDYHKDIRKTYLLHGVTGSGKTEVYMELIAEVIRQGKQAIVLIPEIALTYQTVLRFYRRFGDRISTLNSRLSVGERYDQYLRAKRSEIDVMIGPRSALFTPFPNLGMIIIDEEHEGSYKSEKTPRFHAREVAVERGRMEGASIVLGSATPSVDAYHRALGEEYTLYCLTKRVDDKKMPTVYVADMREELKNGNRTILSDSLRELVRQRLVKKEQIMLFLNRRGYAGFVSCRTCGHVIKCKNCDVSLSYHNTGKLVCHYCGYEEKPTKVCPSCSSPHLGRFWAGTQQVEEYIKQEFPEAVILRMDADTTRSKHGHEKILEAYANREADILIGTQMIVKGHDFPGVTLVGILAADLSLYVGDYRASERTFQLLTQAAGRAGRGEASGEVVIQTYDPNHYSIQASIHQNYKTFYEKEIAYRNLMEYPPVSYLLALYISGKEERLLDTAAEYLRKTSDLFCKNIEAQVIGPAYAMIPKINNTYRKIIYIKYNDISALIKVKNQLEKYININEGFNDLMIQFDMNPLNMF